MSLPKMSKRSSLMAATISVCVTIAINIYILASQLETRKLLEEVSEDKNCKEVSTRQLEKVKKSSYNIMVISIISLVFSVIVWAILIYKTHNLT